MNAVPMLMKIKEYTLAETIALYDDYQRSQNWARTASKINTCLPKNKAAKWDAIEKEANDYMEDVEERLSEAVDQLKEEELEKFRNHYGI
jgi:gas vesicle protein